MSAFFTSRLYTGYIRKQMLYCVSYIFLYLFTVFVGTVRKVKEGALGHIPYILPALFKG